MCVGAETGGLRIYAYLLVDDIKNSGVGCQDNNQWLLGNWKEDKEETFCCVLFKFLYVYLLHIPKNYVKKKN